MLGPKSNFPQQFLPFSGEFRKIAAISLMKNPALKNLDTGYAQLNWYPSSQLSGFHATCLLQSVG